MPFGNLKINLFWRMTMVRIKRTKEQIAQDDSTFANCSLCDTPLRTAKQPRTSAKVCASCRNDGKSDNAELKKLFKELKAKSGKVAEDEMIFEDDPKASKEKDYGRYISKAVEVNFGVSGLVELMTPPISHHHYSNSSGKDGTRYSYRKGKA